MFSSATPLTLGNLLDSGARLVRGSAARLIGGRSDRLSDCHMGSVLIPILVLLEAASAGIRGQLSVVLQESREAFSEFSARFRERFSRATPDD
jgi:hypothetical protein